MMLSWEEDITPNSGTQSTVFLLSTNRNAKLHTDMMKAIG